MNREHLAKEADRLSNDEIFIKALSEIRADALNALVEANADSYTDIVRLQQRVQVIDEIRDLLGRYIMALSRMPQDDASPFA